MARDTSSNRRELDKRVLNAISSGKIRHPFTALPEGRYWREAFREAEDFLTASVFERLSYLPDTVFWDILCRVAIPEKVLPQGKFFLRSISFWPSWVPDERHDVGSRVEPDVFMVFQEKGTGLQVALIVEAKLRASHMPEQWAGEWLAFLAQPTACREAEQSFLLAIGWNSSVSENEVRRIETECNSIVEKKGVRQRVKATACSWESILDAVLKILEPANSEFKNEIERVLSDIVQAFGLHGIRIKTWLKDLPDMVPRHGRNFDLSRRELEIRYRGRSAHRRALMTGKSWIELNERFGTVGSQSFRTLEKWRFGHEQR